MINETELLLIKIYSSNNYLKIIFTANIKTAKAIKEGLNISIY